MLSPWLELSRIMSSLSFDPSAAIRVYSVRCHFFFLVLEWNFMVSPSRLEISGGDTDVCL